MAYRVRSNQGALLQPAQFISSWNFHVWLFRVCSTVEIFVFCCIPTHTHILQKGLQEILEHHDASPNTRGTVFRKLKPATQSSQTRPLDTCMMPSHRNHGMSKRLNMNTSKGCNLAVECRHGHGSMSSLGHKKRRGKLSYCCTFLFFPGKLVVTGTLFFKQTNGACLSRVSTAILVRNRPTTGLHDTILVTCLCEKHSFKFLYLCDQVTYSSLSDLVQWVSD